MEIKKKSYLRRKEKKPSGFCLRTCFSCCFKKTTTSARKLSFEVLAKSDSDKQLSVLYKKKSNGLINATREPNDAESLKNSNIFRGPSSQSQNNLQNDGDKKVLTREQKEKVVKSILQKYLESKQAIKEQSPRKDVVLELVNANGLNTGGEEKTRSLRAELEQGTNFKIGDERKSPRGATSTEYLPDYPKRLNIEFEQSQISSETKHLPHQSHVVDLEHSRVASLSKEPSQNFRINVENVTSPTKLCNTKFEFCTTSKVEQQQSIAHTQSIAIRKNELSSPRKNLATKDVKKSLREIIAVEVEHPKALKIKEKSITFTKNLKHSLLDKNFGELDISQASIYFPAKSKSVPTTNGTGGNFDKDCFSIRSQESKSESCVAYSTNETTSKKMLEVTLTKSFMGESSIPCDNVNSFSCPQSKLSCEVEPLELFSDSSLTTESSTSSAGLEQGTSSTSLKWKLIISPHKGRDF